MSHRTARRPSGRPRRPRRATGLVLAAALLLAGCSLGPSSPHVVGIGRSQLHDGTLTVDLRTHPSRADFGMEDGSTFAGYGSTDRPVRVVIRYPDTDVVFTQADITAATDDAGGANDRDPTHQPKFFTVYVHYPDAAAARSDALSKASPMGLTAQQVRDAVAGPADLYDYQGRPDGWRSARLGFATNTGDPQYNARYFFDLDVFHNSAVDRIKHGDVIDLDLRSSPTRAALGFLPTYLSADVLPDPGRQLTLDLRTPSGSASLRLDEDSALSSDAADGTGPPRLTTATWCQQATGVRRQLLALARPLGLDARRVEALPTTSAKTEKGPTVQLAGRAGETGVRVKYESPGSSGDQACATLFLDYPG